MAVTTGKGAEPTQPEGKAFHCQSHTICDDQQYVKVSVQLLPLIVPSESVDISTIPNRGLRVLYFESAELGTATDERESNWKSIVSSMAKPLHHG